MSELQLPKTAWLALLAIATGLTAVPRTAAANVVIWDTGSRFDNPPQEVDRAAWQAVPSELFVFEADPVKAASDPGYYGREYSFAGDAVVENRQFTAVFSSAQGRLILYAKPDPTLPLGSAGATTGFGNQILELSPLPTQPQPSRISRCEVLRNVGDEAVLEVFFTVPGSAEVSAVFSFGKDEIFGVKPAKPMEGVRLLSPIEYGVVPGFVGDDLIFGPPESAAADALALPSENVFVGLLKGEGSLLVLTWPNGNQQLRLSPVLDPGTRGVTHSVAFDTDGQSLYLAVLNAPGIWHREALKPTYLEKDVALTWKKPFPARWKTQLTEAGVRTTFTFRETAGPIWRGVPGSYHYPVWFDGKTAFYHLSKKVPPKGESIVYFLEGQGTPVAVATPVDILKATLGRPMCDTILDVAGRRLRTHHRRGGEGVRRACTCGCTEAIQEIFEAEQEVARQDEVKQALEDMNFFVQCHVERIDEYRRFAADLIQFLGTTATTAPELKPFCDGLESIVQQIPQECDVQQENMKSLEHAADLTRRTMALTLRNSPENLSAYKELFDDWRAMGGAQDYVLARCHTLVRKLAQDAGYDGAHNPHALSTVMEVRARCRQVLRNPDGYEIWADY